MYDERRWIIYTDEAYGQSQPTFYLILRALIFTVSSKVHTTFLVLRSFGKLENVTNKVLTEISGIYFIRAPQDIPKRIVEKRLEIILGENLGEFY